MSFSLDTPTRLKVRNVSPRKENHGEELVQAIDVDLELETSNECLAMFSPWLLTALYWDKAKNDGQQAIEGVAPSSPNLRLLGLEMPLKWDLELLGRDLRISHGLGGKSDLVLSTAKVKKFRLTAKEGGTVVVGFQVQGNTDVNEKIVGKLCALEGEEIEGTLTGSDPADDKPLNTAGNGEIKSATDLFLEGTKAKTREEALADGTIAWPFPDHDKAPSGKGAPVEEPDPGPAPIAAAKKKQVRPGGNRKVPAKKAALVKYRDPATGQTWSGRGLQPKWVKAALLKGKSLLDFAL